MHEIGGSEFTRTVHGQIWMTGHDDYDAQVGGIYYCKILFENIIGGKKFINNLCVAFSFRMSVNTRYFTSVTHNAHETYTSDLESTDGYL